MNEWEQIFTNAFAEVKNAIQKNYQKDDPERITPNERAILIGADKLPCKVEIINVDCSKLETIRLDDVCQLIKFDLTNLGSLNVIHHGTISFIKEEIFRSVVDKFKDDIDHSRFISEQLMKHAQRSGFPLNNGIYIEFEGYDIQKNIKRFTQDVTSRFFFSFNDYFVKQFKTEKEKNYNSLYDLKNDPVLSPTKLLKPDARTNISLETLQKAISDIQLIPNVPESIKLEFQRAKDLFVFSYFKYEFATLAERSAFFALETAMKQKYVQSLKGKAIITYDSQIVHEITNPTYSQIADFLHDVSRKKGLKFDKIQVNNERFPSTMTTIIEWLGRNGMPKWKLDLYDAGRKLRNSLAHPEEISIFLPSSTTLRNIAYDINEMFDVKSKFP